MRAKLYSKLENCKVNDEVIIDEDTHHLLNVVRVQVNDELLLLDGNGLKVHSKIVSLSKKQVVARLDSIERSGRNNLSVAIGCPKRESFEDCLKRCTELGVSHIIPLITKYSQLKNLNIERCQKILTSSLEQSNNSYMPKLLPLTDISKLELGPYENKICLSMFSGTNKKISYSEKNDLLLIGPEGGFDTDEEEELRSQEFQFLNFPTPILKTSTAVCVAIAHRLSCSVY